MAEPETDDRAKDVIQNLGHLKTIRQPFELTIDKLFTYVNHSRGKITDGDTNKGQKTGTEVYDGSALSAANLLTDGMVGYLCSRSIRWRKSEIPQTYRLRNGHSRRLDEYPEVATYLQDLDDQMFRSLQRSNFYDRIPEFFRDGIVPGTAYMLMEEEVGEKRLVCTVPHFRECYIAENRFGKVDTCYRVFKMTLRQMVEKFTLERMKEADQNFLKCLEDNPFEEREVINAIFPRKDYDPARLDVKGKVVASLWVYRASKEKQELLLEEGYHGMPMIVWRWRKNNNEVYGRSPAWDALVPILLANQQGRTNLVGGHKMVEPPMVGPADMRGKVNNVPNGWTWMESFSGSINDRQPRPLMTGIQLPYAIDQLDRTRASIEDHFATKFFLALTQAAAQGTEMTATQVIEMMGERAAILCTRVGMLESEALDPIYDRQFEIEMRAGRLPEIPDILLEAAGSDIVPKYTGLLAQAQLELSELRKIQSDLSLIGQIAQFSPTALDVVDCDDLAMRILRRSGFPSTSIRTPEVIEGIRRSRMEAQQRQETVAALPAIAKASKMAGAKPEDGSPMAALMGQGQEATA